MTGKQQRQCTREIIEYLVGAGATDKEVVTILLDTVQFVVRKSEITTKSNLTTRVVLLQDTQDFPPNIINEEIQSNHHIWMVNLGKKLGFNGYEDWYGILKQDFLDNDGADLLACYHDDPLEAVIAIFNEYRFLSWKFKFLPRKFNKNEKVDEYINSSYELTDERMDFVQKQAEIKRKNLS